MTSRRNRQRSPELSGGGVESEFMLAILPGALASPYHNFPNGSKSEIGSTPRWSSHSFESFPLGRHVQNQPEGDYSTNNNFDRVTARGRSGADADEIHSPEDFSTNKENPKHCSPLLHRQER